jgi:hypothetical protein
VAYLSFRQPATVQNSTVSAEYLHTSTGARGALPEYRAARQNHDAKNINVFVAAYG